MRRRGGCARIALPLRSPHPETHAFRDRRHARARRRPARAVLAGRTPDLRIANATLSQLSYVPFIIRPAPEAPKSPRYYTGIKFRQNESPPYEDRAAAGLRADHAAAKEPQSGPAAHGGRDTRGLPPAARDADQPGRIRSGQPRLSDRLRQRR